MKILFTTNIPVPYRIDFFNELGKYVDLTVVFERTEAHTRNSSWLKTNFNNFKGIFMRGLSVGDDCAFCPEIINIIKSGRFDKIIVGTYYSPTGILATEYMRLHHIPFSFSGDGGFVKNENKVKYMIKRHLQGDGELYFSPSLKGDEVIRSLGVPEGKIRRYSFTSLWEKDILKRTISEKEKFLIRKKLKMREDFIILGVGRLLELKGWDTLLELADPLGGAVGIYIVGGDPVGTYYERIAEKLKTSNVHFVDFKEKSELAEYYKAANVFVLPTHGDVWGLVINEAMAYGLPVITTNQCIAGLELVKSNENGFLTEANDSEAVFEHIMQLLHDKSLCARMGERSLQIIQNYTIEKMAFDYYSALIEEN